MYELIQIIPEKLRWLILGMPALFATLLLFSLLLAATTPSNAINTSDSPNNNISMYDGSNAITNGMNSISNKLTIAAVSIERTNNNALRSLGAAVGSTSRGITRALHNSVTFVGHGLGASATFTARAVSSSFGYIVRVPGNVLGFASNAPIVSAVIKPSDKATIPLINPSLPSSIAKHDVLSDAKTVSLVTVQNDAGTEWPIHGEITTPFGVPHWPYQPTHTGLDISDGKPSGVTGIKPFKPGRVIDTVRSNAGLGNHIIVDHGSGLTSVYGHLASISVVIGQAVDKSTVLGFEGSTGASTGTHLHFEIIVDGIAKNPLLFVNGRP